MISDQVLKYLGEDYSSSQYRDTAMRLLIETALENGTMLESMYHLFNDTVLSCVMNGQQCNYR